MRLVIKDSRGEIVSVRDVGGTREARKYMHRHGEPGEVGLLWRESDWRALGGSPCEIIRAPDNERDPAMERLWSWKSLFTW